MLNGNEPFQPGLYAEIVHIFPKIFSIEKDDAYLKGVLWLADWYLKNQTPDGAYKMSPDDKLPNTRKTGKVIEVLSSLISDSNINSEQKERYYLSLVRAANWIITMQITEDKIETDAFPIRKKILGGIKHTPLDCRLWIDSSAHFLLAAIRLNSFPAKF